MLLYGHTLGTSERSSGLLLRDLNRYPSCFVTVFQVKISIFSSCRDMNPHYIQYSSHILRFLCLRYRRLITEIMFRSVLDFVGFGWRLGVPCSHGWIIAIASLRIAAMRPQFCSDFLCVSLTSSTQVIYSHIRARHVWRQVLILCCFSRAHRVLSRKQTPTDESTAGWLSNLSEMSFLSQQYFYCRCPMCIGGPHGPKASRAHVY